MLLKKKEEERIVTVGKKGKGKEERGEERTVAAKEKDTNGEGERQVGKIRVNYQERE